MGDRPGAGPFCVLPGDGPAGHIARNFEPRFGDRSAAADSGDRVLVYSSCPPAPALARFAFYQATGRPATLQETLSLSCPPAPSPAAAGAPDLAAHHRRLVNLLYGDTAAAARLLQAAYQQHLDRPAVWIYEKVIQDLVNDRMR